MRNHVLIVDDSLTVRMDLADGFARDGFSPVLCGTIREARDILGERGVALTILDVNLPDGNGIELLAAIRAVPAPFHMPILLLTGESDLATRMRGIEAGADGYVTKPYDRSRVIALARTLIRGGERDTAKQSAPVLLVDDSPTFREALRGALEEADYRVVIATNAGEALETIKLQRPTAVIADFVMPGMDGDAFIRQLQRRPETRDIPCVLLTGMEGHTVGERAQQAGALAYFRKDEDLDVLLARIRAVLRSQVV